MSKVYVSIDLKSFYASVECVERGLDPLDAYLVVADPSRTEKTICLAVTPALKAYGISPNLFGASAQALFDAPALGLLRQYGALLAASAVLACPFALTLRKKVMEKHPAALALAAAVLFFLCTAFLATDNYNPFLYFRF